MNVDPHLTHTRSRSTTWCDSRSVQRLAALPLIVQSDQRAQCITPNRIAESSACGDDASA
jgi:hypothetical protein